MLDHTQRLDDLFPTPTDVIPRPATEWLGWPAAMRVILLLSCSAWMLIALIALALGVI